MEIRNLSKLQKLDCSRNRLTSLPTEIGDLSQLRELACSSNELTSLPEQIGELSQLQKLVCNFNQLTSLPPEIGRLSQLEELYCNTNQLTSLPAEIGKLGELQALNCGYNSFVRLPLSLARLSKVGFFKFKLESISYATGIEVNRQMLLFIYQQESEKFFPPFFKFYADKQTSFLPNDVYREIYQFLLADFDNIYVIYRLNARSGQHELVVEE